MVAKHCIGLEGDQYLGKVLWKTRGDHASQKLCRSKRDTCHWLAAEFSEQASQLRIGDGGRSRDVLNCFALRAEQSPCRGAGCIGAGDISRAAIANKTEHLPSVYDVGSIGEVVFGI